VTDFWVDVAFGIETVQVHGSCLDASDLVFDVGRHQVLNGHAVRFWQGAFFNLALQQRAFAGRLFFGFAVSVDVAPFAFGIHLIGWDFGCPEFEFLLERHRSFAACSSGHQPRRPSIQCPMYTP
jgi:hypothetical protein